ncbi:MAG: hypothetical protein COW01_01175, partial [Bdellovibrionales bacterium CG12_big_fil_rev_8_21_14_0_65_38_15]
KNGFFFLLLNLFLISKIFAAELKAINFTQQGEISQLELLLDTNEAKAAKFQIKEDKQIIIDLEDVTSTERVMRSFDASEFSGAVVFVSAYKKPETKNDLRIAVQLRDNVRSVLKRKENAIVLQIENRFGVFNQRVIEENNAFEEKITGEKTKASELLVPKTESIDDILENLTLSGQKKYIGKRISINVKAVPVSDILKMISDVSGFNVILTDDVKKTEPLTLSLTNVPWDQALDTILTLNKLVAKKNGKILIVQSLLRATEDKKLEAESKLQALSNEPLVTKIFPVSYATTKDLTDIIKSYITKERGSISEDVRTNSLIVKDTTEVIEKIRKIIEVLDTQTPQVLIESKIVEVSESYSKEIGLKNGFNFGYDPIGAPALTTGDIGVSAVGGTDVGPGFSFSSAPINGESARNLFSLSIGQFGRLVDLNFALQLMENESKGKIIASPKVITQNKKAANLTTSDTTSFSVTNGAGDTATTSFQEVSADLSLDVTPQVTNEGSIALEISISKSQFGTRPSPDAPPNKQTRKVKTNVLVDNGSTIVLGGIYSYTKSESVSGIPFLKDIPLIGWLFRTPYAPSTTKNEMIIFLTPRIINQEEAGLADRG